MRKGRQRKKWVERRQNASSVREVWSAEKAVRLVYSTLQRLPLSSPQLSNAYKQKKKKKTKQRAFCHRCSKETDETSRRKERAALWAAVITILSSVCFL
jgi:hypothetical protein